MVVSKWQNALENNTYSNIRRYDRPLLSMLRIPRVNGLHKTHASCLKVLEYNNRLIAHECEQRNSVYPFEGERMNVVTGGHCRETFEWLWANSIMATPRRLCLDASAVKASRVSNSMY